MFSLTNPITQTVIIPIVVSFVAVGLLRLVGGSDRGRWLAALGIGLGLIAAYWVTFGIPDFPPVGASRKMFAILVIAAILGLTSDLMRLPTMVARILTALVGVAAILWIGGDKALGEVWPSGVVVLLLMVVMAAAGWRLGEQAEQPTEGGVPLLVTALGMAIVAFIGNTASSAQLAGATAAALGGFLLWNWPKARFRLGPSGLMPVLALLAALATQLALFTKIGAYVLIPLGFALFADLAVRRPATGLLRPLAIGIAAAIAAGVAVALAYLTTPQSSSPY